MSQGRSVSLFECEWASIAWNRTAASRTTPTMIAIRARETTMRMDQSMALRLPPVHPGAGYGVAIVGR